MAHAQLTAQARCVHVIGTTGFSDDDIAALDAAARHATIVRAGNMSLGVKPSDTAGAAGRGLRSTAISTSRWSRGTTRHKVDAPSGTALMLGEAAAAGRGVNLSEVTESGRDGITGPRAENANRVFRHSRRRYRGGTRRDLRRTGRADRRLSYRHGPGHLRSRRAQGRALGSGQAAGSLLHGQRAGFRRWRTAPLEGKTAFR